MFTRENAKLIAVATACLIGGAAIPPAAAAVLNADTVDGKSAVGAGATMSARKGKLVATNPTTGLLPGNIIAKAPDSARLGGNTAAQTRSMNIPASSGKGTAGVALNVDGGITLPPDASITWNFVVPPDHKAGTPMYADLVFQAPAPPNLEPGCTMQLSTSGAHGPLNNGEGLPDSWNAGGDLTFPVTPAETTIAKKTLTWDNSATTPGMFVTLRLTRPVSVADTCSPEAVAVRALQIRY